MNVSLRRSAIFTARAFGIAEPGTPPKGCSASAAFQRLGCRVIGTATAKNDIFAITINRHTIGGIVGVDLERGAPAVGT